MKYNLLQKNSSPDKEKLNEYLILLRDIRRTETSLRRLKMIKDDNEDEMDDFIWTTKEGDIMSIYEMSDEHIARVLHKNFAGGRKEANLERIAIERGLGDYGSGEIMLIEENTNF